MSRSKKRPSISAPSPTALVAVSAAARFDSGRSAHPCCIYRVPEGCVVRGTFLEWKGSLTPSGDKLEGGISHLAEGRLDDVVRSSRSCPAALIARCSPAGSPRRSVHGAILPVERGQACAGHIPKACPENGSPDPSGAVVKADCKGDGRLEQSIAQAEPSLIVLRGLPWDVTQSDVLSFARTCGVSHQDLRYECAIVLLSGSRGRPSGLAELHLTPGADCVRLAEGLHLQSLGDRYVEAIPGAPARALQRHARRRQFRHRVVQ